MPFMKRLMGFLRRDDPDRKIVVPVADFSMSRRGFLSGIAVAGALAVLPAMPIEAAETETRNLGGHTLADFNDFIEGTGPPFGDMVNEAVKNTYYLERMLPS